MTKYLLVAVTLILVTGAVVGTTLVGQAQMYYHKKVDHIESTLKE